MEQTKTRINGSVVTGRRFRRLIDKETDTWERFSGWIVTDKPFQLATQDNTNQKEK